MWNEKLKKIEENMVKFSYGPLSPGVSTETIELWMNGVKKALGTIPPVEYVQILKHVNGVEWNGFILYGVDKEYLQCNLGFSSYGLIEQNTLWYENEHQKKYLFLGESNISWYVYKIESKEFIVLDNPSGREIEIYSSFVDMFEQFLDDSLK